MKIATALVHVYAQGKHCRFVASEKLSNSYFGGPLSIQVGGKAHGPDALHQFVVLSPSDIPLLRECHLHLPLLYGMRFSDCRLRYHLKSFQEIDVLEINPKKSSHDWPYPNYPKYLPYIQLELTDSTSCTWEKFSEPFANAPEKLPGDLFAVVPPPATMGVSLWGRNGDLEFVNVVWEFDAKSKTVTAYNICG